jgi:hypothetical protein
MTSRTDIAISLARAANPVEPDPNHSAWADAEGQAAFEQIIASPVADPMPAPRLPRTRRRLAIGVGLAAAAGAAVAVVGLPGSPNHGGTPAAAAWAVTKNADGSVTVNIKDNRDPAGLEARLREAGVRAKVSVVPDSCAGPMHSDRLLNAQFDGDLSTFTGRYTWKRLFAGSPEYALFGPGSTVSYDKPPAGAKGPATPDSLSFTVHPNELPPNDTLNIGFPSPDNPFAGRTMTVDVEKTGTPITCYDPANSEPTPSS